MPQVRNAVLSGDRVAVELENGRTLSIRVAAPAEAASWISPKQPYAFGDPVLFVARRDEASVARAVAAMAADMGGYWLRYYDASPVPQSSVKVVPLGTAAWTDSEKGCGVVDAVLKDGREFSLLAATPEWFAQAFARLKLPYYFGPCVLFLKGPEAAAARAAAKAMALAGDRWLCRYDTPRMTLPGVLERFKASHN